MKQQRERAGSTTLFNRFSTRASSLLVTGMLAALSGAVAAAGGAAPQSWKEIEAGAHKEGRLMIYGALANPIMDRLRADFTKAYPGINTDYFRLASGQLLSRIEQERQTGAEGGDVLVNTEIGWAEDKAREGVLKALVGPSVSAWPKEFLLHGSVPILALEPIGVVYNTNLVKNPPATYQDLLKPEFKGGKVGVLDLVATTVVAFYDWLEKDQGPGYLAKLAAQQPRIYVSVPVGLQNVSAGELPIASFANPAQAFPLMKQGAPIKIFYPPRVLGFRYTGTALGWSKRPNAALVFVDYLMSRRGQQVWNGEGEGASPLPNIPGSLNVKSIVPYDPKPYTPEVQKAFKAKWDALFKK